MIHWRQFSLTDGGVPKSAAKCGLEADYRYWLGASGTRYLFTVVDADEVGAFDDVVVVLARGDGVGGYAAVDVVNVGAAGEADRHAVAKRVAGDSRLTAFVHLLAEEPATRREVAADLIGFAERLAA